MNEFNIHDQEKQYKYPPFILEIIVEMVSNGFNYDEIKYEFESEILQYDEDSDNVMFRICTREVTKKEEYGFHLEVDQQIRFMCDLAIEEKGKVQDKDFDKILLKLKLQDRLSDIVRGLRDHPLLLKNNGDYLFRFDFFNTYFKALGIYNLLSSDSNIKVTDRLINILAFECNFNSVIYKNLLTRLSKENNFEKILNNSRILFQKILSFDTKEKNYNISIDTKKKSISNTLLALLKSTKKPLYSHSYIILELFSSEPNDKSLIKDFYFIDVPSIADVIFDFSNIIFSNSEIYNYSNFFKCTFNSDTFFDETCTISNINTNKLNLKNISFSLYNFDKNIKGDNSIFRVLSLINNGNSAAKYIKSYLKGFYINKTFLYQQHKNAITIPYDDFITFDLISNILKNNKIIENVENGSVTINDLYESKIIKYLTQALPFPELRRSIRDLEVAFTGIKHVE
jgi:hypothetical protein